MRQTARIAILAAAVVVATPLTAAFTPAAGTAGADGVQTSSGGTFLPFTQRLRRCDFSKTKYNGPTGYGRPTAVMRSDGSNVVADVQIASAIPNMHYDVRLIQTPRPSSQTCVGGDPGVAVAALNTDGAGAAAVTLSDNVEPGATGAWVFISRPDAFSQNPAEFYTSEFVAPI